MNLQDSRLRGRQLSAIAEISEDRAYSGQSARVVRPRMLEYSYAGVAVGGAEERIEAASWPGRSQRRESAGSSAGNASDTAVAAAPCNQRSSMASTTSSSTIRSA